MECHSSFSQTLPNSDVQNQPEIDINMSKTASLPVLLMQMEPYAVGGKEQTFTLTQGRF